MITNTELKKKLASRLAFFYPWVFLVLVLFVSAIAGAYASKLTPQDLDNAARGMTAFTGLAVFLAAFGYAKLKECR